MNATTQQPTGAVDEFKAMLQTMRDKEAPNLTSPHIQRRADGFINALLEGQSRPDNNPQFTPKNISSVFYKAITYDKSPYNPGGNNYLGDSERSRNQNVGSMMRSIQELYGITEKMAKDNAPAHNAGAEAKALFDSANTYRKFVNPLEEKAQFEARMQAQKKPAGIVDRFKTLFKLDTAPAQKAPRLG
jgi:hypothetical protein